MELEIGLDVEVVDFKGYGEVTCIYIRKVTASYIGKTNGGERERV